jgi:hypothetical protein
MEKWGMKKKAQKLFPALQIMADLSSSILTRLQNPTRTKYPVLTTLVTSEQSDDVIPTSS